MQRRSYIIIPSLPVALLFAGCATPHSTESSLPAPPETVRLTCSFKLNRSVYLQSDYAEPPQYAVWIENAESHEIRTLCVTHRTGQGDWKGKMGCPVSLPYWVTRYNRESNTDGPPTPQRPAPDAITRPTCKDPFAVQADIPRGSRWHYFIEVNVSGDFNERFPPLEAGRDDFGNGQPSLVYAGQLVALPGARDVPKLLGRTLQDRSTEEVVTDLDGITTAKELLLDIEVRCDLPDSIHILPAPR